MLTVAIIAIVAIVVVCGEPPTSVG